MERGREHRAESREGREVGGDIGEEKEGLGHKGRRPRDSPPAICAYHHHIDFILNIHIKSRDRGQCVSVFIV